jgi:hypothetical protein
MQAKWLVGSALAVVLTACSSTENIGSGSGTTGGTGGGAGLGAGGTGGGADTNGGGFGGKRTANGTGGSPAISMDRPEDPSRPSCRVLGATDDNGYKITVSSAVVSFSVKPSSELTIDWSALGHNLAGDPIDPRADIDDLVVGLVDAQASVLEQLLVDDEVGQAQLVAVWEAQTGEARTAASTFDLVPLNGVKQSQADLLGYFEADAVPEGQSYFVMVSKGTTVGSGVQAFTVFSLDEASSDTTITLTDDLTTVIRGTYPPILPDPSIPAGIAGITLDFDQLDHDARGRAISWQNIVKVEVIMTSADASSGRRNGLLDLPRDHVWQAPLDTVASVNLATLIDAEGNAFAGVDQEHGWLLALYDDRSLLPVPAYLVVLDPDCTN